MGGQGGRNASFFCPRLHCEKHLLALMVGLLRLHCYRNGVLNLVFVEHKDAKQKRKELLAEDWTITHTEHV